MNKEIITVEDKSINEKCLIYRHKSGLTVCYAPKKLSVTYVSLTVKFGALCQNVKFDDGDSYENLPDGVAHFMEHKIFARPDGSDALNELAYFGANGNAYTTEKIKTEKSKEKLTSKIIAYAINNIKSVIIPLLNLLIMKLAKKHMPMSKTML